MVFLGDDPDEVRGRGGLHSRGVRHEAACTKESRPGARQEAAAGLGLIARLINVPMCWARGLIQSRDNSGKGEVRLTRRPWRM